MKVTQIIGLLLSILAFGYFASFAARIASPEEQGSATLSIGLIMVFFLAFASAILLIPSSFMLWRKRTREHYRFSGLIWKTVLGLNSTLAIIYSGFALLVVGTLLFTWAGR